MSEIPYAEQLERRKQEVHRAMMSLIARKNELQPAVDEFAAIVLALGAMDAMQTSIANDIQEAYAKRD